MEVMNELAVGRDEVRRLVAEGAQLVDVLPADEFAEEHLPGAISVPLKQLNAETARQLDRDRPVIVYCHDYQ
jgi:rhodanese-related sulfurtransferase